LRRHNLCSRRRPTVASPLHSTLLEGSNVFVRRASQPIRSGPTSPIDLKEGKLNKGKTGWIDAWVRTCVPWISASGLSESTSRCMQPPPARCFFLPPHTDACPLSMSPPRVGAEPTVDARHFRDL
jgi:hypothetical protein